MGDKDKTTKLLEDYNDVFKDIFDVLLFGKETINEKKLKAGLTESIYKMDNEELHEQRRDILKDYYDSTLHISSFGIENESKYNKFMPFRVMNYDGATYMEQIKCKKTKIKPIITIVLNFSNRKWGKAKSLFDAMNVPDELKPFISNYEIRVYDIAFLDDKTISKFKSDFRLVAKFLKAKRLNKIDQFFEEEGAVELDHIYELLAMLSAITKDKKYEMIAPSLLEKVKKGGKVHMCEVATKLEEKGRMAEKEEGLKAIINTIKNISPNMCFEDAYKWVVRNETYKSVTQEQVKKYF